MDTAEKPAQRQKRRYGQSCEICRRQKKRCEGRDENGKSLCTYCAKHGLECTFPASGEKSKLEAAISRGDQLEIFVKELAATPVELRDARLAAFAKDRSSMLPPSPTHPPAKKRRVSNQPSPGGLQNSYASGSGSTPGDDDLHTTRRTSSVDELQSLPGAAGLLALADMASEPSMSMQGSTLPRWLDYCIQTLDKAGLAAGFDAGQIDLMLESFFSFHNPRFRFIDRNLFGRSIQANDHRFCSPFLLASILAFTLKYAPSWQHRMEELGARAHMLLAQELAEPAKLTTVQGLLILCNYHANLRRTTLCSQYLRLANTLLQAYPDFNEHMPVEEQRLHAQLQWTIYAMACYMNISFINHFRGVVRRPPKELVDSFPFGPDAELWKPVWLPGESRGSSPVSVQPTYEHSTFIQTCKFYVILDDILSAVYVDRSDNSKPPPQVFEDLRERLEAAQAAVPPILMLDCKTCPWPCPTLHVLAFNVLVRVCWLLLFQPKPASIGKLTSEGIEEVLRALSGDVQTLFAIGHAHYPSRLSFLFIYGVFSGAAIDLDRLKQMKAHGLDHEAERATISRRLAHTLDALQTCRHHILGINESVALLKKNLDATLGPDANVRGHMMPPYSHAPSHAAPSPFSSGATVTNESLNWLLDWSNGQVSGASAPVLNGHSHVSSPGSLTEPVSLSAAPPTDGLEASYGMELSMSNTGGDQLATLLRDLVGDNPLAAAELQSMAVS